MDLNSGSRPTKTISPIGKGREHPPGLSVCLYGLSVCDPACLLYRCSTGDSLSVTKHFWRVGTNVYMVG